MIIDTNGPQTYRYAGWYRLIQLFAWLFVGSLVAVVLTTAFLSARASLQASSQADRLTGALLLCAFSPLILLAVVLLVEMVLGIINLFAGYVRITPEGIEQKVFPFKHIAARWRDVERVDHYGLYQGAFLREYQVMGTSLSYSRPLVYLNFSKNVMPLSIYQGWGGPLEEAVRRYAPGAFTPPEPAQVPSGGEQPASSGISTDDRALAAIAHASILFLPVIIPLVILYTRRGRAGYAAAQAVQAALFQGICMLLSFAITSVLFLLVPAVALFGTAFGRVPPETGPAFLVAALLVSLLLILFNLVITVYAIAGAVFSSMGKEFRYFGLGRVAERWVH